MPDVTNAITGQASLYRKREKVAKEAAQDFQNLPNWIFWEKAQIDDYIETNVTNLAEAKTALKSIGYAITLIVKYLKQYKET